MTLHSKNVKHHLCSFPELGGPKLVSALCTVINGMANSCMPYHYILDVLVSKATHALSLGCPALWLLQVGQLSLWFWAHKPTGKPDTQSHLHDGAAGMKIGVRDSIILWRVNNPPPVIILLNKQKA